MRTVHSLATAVLGRLREGLTVTKTTKTTSKSTDRITAMILIAVIILGAALVAALILGNLPTWLQSGTSTIVILLVAGLVAVMLLLYLGTMILRTAGLASRKEALGMPAGSIRALIALSLILMFAIIGVTVLYSGMGGDPIESRGLTQAQVDQLENVQIISMNVVDPAASPGTEQFNVTARPELSPVGHDFGLQLLTTVSTLVVAVAGFYFGTSAVSQGAKTAAAAQAAATLAATTTSTSATDGSATLVAGDAIDIAPIEEDDLVGAVEDVSDDIGDEEFEVADEGDEAPPPRP